MLIRDEPKGNVRNTRSYTEICLSGVLIVPKEYTKEKRGLTNFVTKYKIGPINNYRFYVKGIVSVSRFINKRKIFNLTKGMTTKINTPT